MRKSAPPLPLICSIAVLSLLQLLTCTVLSGQTTVSLRTQSKDIDFSNAPSTRPAKTGTVLPATCNVGEFFFLTNAAAGNNVYGCASTNNWSLQGGSGTGSALPQMQVTAGGTAMTIGVGCAASAPCNVRIGSTVFTFTNPVPVTLSSGSGTAYVYFDSTGALIVGHNFGSNAISCSTPCAAVDGVTAFPPDSIPIWTWTASSGQWNAAGGGDERAAFSQKLVTCGANLVCTNSGTVLTISGSAAAAGGLTAPITDFGDHSSAATTSSQVLTSITVPGGSMAANNNYAILAITGTQSSPNNLIALNFGSTALYLGNNTTTLSLASGSTFTIDCKVVRTGPGTQRISCASGIGQNVAGPYVNTTSGTEDLTAGVVISVKATTNGNAGDVVLRTLEFRPVNF